MRSKICLLSIFVGILIILISFLINDLTLEVIGILVFYGGLIGSFE